MKIQSSLAPLARKALLGTIILGAMGTVAAFAQEAAPAATDAAAAAPTPVPDKGDTTWMLVSTVLVIMMTIPGLALFYGGLVRAKNMLSVLMQVLRRLLHDRPPLGDLRLLAGLLAGTAEERRRSRRSSATSQSCSSAGSRSTRWPKPSPPASSFPSSPSSSSS